MTESRVGKRPGIHNFFSSGIAQGAVLPRMIFTA